MELDEVLFCMITSLAETSSGPNPLVEAWPMLYTHKWESSTLNLLKMGQVWEKEKQSQTI